MKKLLLCCLSILNVLLVSGCGSDDSQVVIDAQSEYGCSTLNVYNAGEYIDPDTLDSFEKKYNAKVNYSLFDSNESMYTKLLSGNSYDVLYPSDYMIERLIEEDLLQPLDKDVIVNIEQIDDAYLNLSYDPGNVYSIPYFYGTVGILYNSDNVDSSIIEQQGFNVFVNSEFKNRVIMYDSERDAFMVAFKALGYSMNTDNEDEVQQAYQWLLKMNSTVNPSYMTDEVIDAMIGNEKDIAIVYSGDAAYIMTENPSMAYYEPESGTNSWSDAMVIPANSSCPALANEYINYMSDYEQAYANSLYVGYATPNVEAREELAESDYEGISAYKPRSNGANDEVFKNNETLKKTLADLWIRVKSSK